MNVTKTKTMVIGTKNRLARLAGQRLNVTIDGQTIKNTESHKLLGLEMDESLSWDLHIDSVGSKLSKRIALLKSIKVFLPLCARQSFYRALIQPIIDYACVVWGATKQSNINRIIRLQKYAARVILNVKYPQDMPSAEMFEKLNWKTLPQRIRYFTSILMYKSVNSLAPDYLTQKFHFVKDKHNVNTRHAAQKKVCIPKFSTTTGQRSFSYRGPKQWNDLPLEFKNCSLSSFKSKLATHI